MLSKQAFAGILGRLVASPIEGAAAITVGIRHLSVSNALQHVQPAPAHDVPPSNNGDKPRWLAELGAIRTDWTYVMRFFAFAVCQTAIAFSSSMLLECSRDEVSEVYNAPLLELIHNAATVHRMHNDPAMVRCRTRMHIDALFNILLSNKSHKDGFFFSLHLCRSNVARF